jgi:hypothetical protein
VLGVPSSDHRDEPQLGAGDLTELSDDQLVAAIQRSEQLRKEGRARTGRLLAELHRRGQLSWPAIARLTGIRQTTAYELAQPYLTTDIGDESSPG